MRALKRYDVGGVMMTSLEMAEASGLPKEIIQSRLQFMTPEAAMNTPRRTQAQYTLDGEVTPLEEILEVLHCSKKMVCNRAKASGETIQQVIDKMYEEKRANEARLEKARASEKARAEEAPVWEHWCFGCAWARWVGDKVTCPFVAGSCAKVKGTLRDPEGDAATGTALKRLKRKRKYRERGLACERENAADGEGEAGADGAECGGAGDGHVQRCAPGASGRGEGGQGASGNGEILH